MKTQIKTKSRQFIYVVLVAILFFLLAFANLMVVKAQSEVKTNASSMADTVKIKSFTGKIIDNETKKAIVFANVYLDGSNIGTVTNSDGEFLIKIPVREKNAKIGIAHLGYKNLMVDAEQLTDKKNVIFLDPVTIPIEEVTVKFTDPEQLIFHAIQKRTDNYSTEPVMLTSFYRETIKQNRNYVAVSEAVVDIYKSPYVMTLETDRSKIYKGRKSQDVMKMDTILFKLQGGPYTALLLDVVKHPGEVLSEDFINLYDYTFIGINYIDDRQTYVIGFEQKPYIIDPLYQGRVYIDAENLAFTRIDFNLNMENSELVSQMFIRKKPAGMKVEVLDANYMTQYRQVENTWYLNYIRLEARFKCNWKKKLFNSVYTTMTEMAVTDIDMENVKRFKYKESGKMSDILAEQVYQFEDPDFWGEHNIIKPDESIEEAISKLNKKVKERL